MRIKRCFLLINKRHNEKCDNLNRLSRKDHFKSQSFFSYCYSYYVPEFSNLYWLISVELGGLECLADEMIRRRTGMRDKKAAVSLIRKRPRTSQTFRATLNFCIGGGINLMTRSTWCRGLIRCIRISLDEVCFNYVEIKVSFASTTLR